MAQRIEIELARLLAEKTGLPLDKPEACTCQYPTVVARNMCGHAPDCPVYIAWAKDAYGKDETAVPESLDCRSEEGVTVGLIDALISIGRILSKRDLATSYHVKEALKDFLLDADMKLILAAAREAMEEEQFQPVKGSGLADDIKRGPQL